MTPHIFIRLVLYLLPILTLLCLYLFSTPVPCCYFSQLSRGRGVTIFFLLHNFYFFIFISIFNSLLCTFHYLFHYFFSWHIFFIYIDSFFPVALLFIHNNLYSPFHFHQPLFFCHFGFLLILSQRSSNTVTYLYFIIFVFIITVASVYILYPAFFISCPQIIS